MERVFCNWNRPALDGILDFLQERFINHSGEFDLGDCVLVFSSSKAGRRLQEKLAIFAEEKSLFLIPPQIITIGSLPELLYQPKEIISSTFESQLARVQVLKNFDQRKINQVFGLAPQNNEINGWVKIAKNINSLSQEISANYLTFRDLNEILNQAPFAPEDQRWEILAEIDEEYIKKLQSVNLIDREVARRQAIENHLINFSRNIIFCSVRDLNRVVQKMIDQLDSQVVALIHAPQSEADAFDLYGNIKVDYWLKRELNIRDEQIIPTSDFRDQALAMLEALSNLGGAFHQSDIIIGQTNEALVPYIENIFKEASQLIHHASGRGFLKLKFGIILKNIKDYLAKHEIRYFLNIIRIPEVEDLIRAKLVESGINIEDSLIAKVDRYQINHLQTTTIKIPKNLNQDDLIVVSSFKILEEIISEFQGKNKSLDEWIVDLQTFCLSFSNNFFNTQELEAINKVMSLISETEKSFLLTLNGYQALEVFINLFEDLTVPSIRNEHELETLGWLELQLEDVPVMLIAGMNEGYIPEAINADPFLPQATRKYLGLIDNDHRYARDAFVLEALLNAVPNLKLFYSLIDSDGSPLMPSRLLVGNLNKNFLPRVKRLYFSNPKRRILDIKRTYNNPVIWQIPPRPVPEGSINRLSVTGFKNYLSCPYRFYLSEILKLKDQDDSLLEMDGRSFGNIGHEILARFMKSPEGSLVDLKQIEQKLNLLVDLVFLDFYGKQPLPAVLIQKEQLWTRLRNFAKWQSNWRKEGWTTTESETDTSLKSMNLKVDGKDFNIFGRIDRIDFHPVLKKWAVIDYKFGENTPEVEKAHRKKETWIDLQLPLYHYLLIENGFIGEIDLGYLRLSPGLEDNQLASFGMWTAEELGEALELTKEIIRKIRNQEFWPPSEMTFPNDPLIPLLGLEQFMEQEDV